MTKIPVKSRIPIEAWTVAVLVTLYSLISSALHAPSEDASVLHAKLMSAADPIITSAIR